ncbi:hypothetical protein, partial [Actinomadura sp. 7K507]|uniref:hypothetical protein n=1 Tax=Actinomadura sp. 7K507 TaxID=2530365 RepID=UPI001A9FD422
MSRGEAACGRGGDRGAAERLRVEAVLAQTAEWDAERLTEEAAAHDERADAEDAEADVERRGALDAPPPRRSAPPRCAGGWMRWPPRTSGTRRPTAERDADEVSRHDRQADVHRLRAESAADRMEAAQHRSAAESLAAEPGTAEQEQRERDAAAERQRAARERDERIRERVLRRERRERGGLRRLLPGPGRTFYSPGMIGTASRWSPDTGIALDREINAIAQALHEHGPLHRRRRDHALAVRPRVRSRRREGLPHRVRRAALRPGLRPQGQRGRGQARPAHRPVPPAHVPRHARAERRLATHRAGRSHAVRRGVRQRPPGLTGAVGAAGP